MNDDELDAKKWRRFWTVFEQMGIYPAKYDGKDRTAYGEGWNDCQVQFLACLDILEKFYNSTDPMLADKIQKLNEDGILFFHLEKDDFFGIVKMGVNCNDLFWWACADIEEISLEEIPTLYDACYDEGGNKKDWGSSIWACLHRKMRPQHPMEDSMKKDGAWTDELEALPIRGNTG
jgi:hypothetical protein